jgi:hypothetical protein
LARRAAATRERTAFHEGSGPALRAARKAGRSPEQRRRLEEILHAFEAVPPGEGLRPLRAVEALERIGTDGARDLLEVLARGVPEARRTQEAKASLERLARRDSLKPWRPGWRGRQRAGNPPPCDRPPELLCARQQAVARAGSEGGTAEVRNRTGQDAFRGAGRKKGTASINSLRHPKSTLSHFPIPIFRSQRGEPRTELQAVDWWQHHGAAPGANDLPPREPGI